MMNRIKDQALDGGASDPAPEEPALTTDDEAREHEEAVETMVSADGLKFGMGAALEGTRPAEERSETALSLKRAAEEGGGSVPD